MTDSCFHVKGLRRIFLVQTFHLEPLAEDLDHPDNPLWNPTERNFSILLDQTQMKSDDSASGKIFTYTALKDRLQTNFTDLWS